MNRSVCLLVLSLALMGTACHVSCATCSGASAWQCLTCNAGYFLQPQAVNLCFTYCPTGYTPNPSTNVCDGAADVIVDYVLDTITPSVLDKHRNWPSRNGFTASYYPPNFEASDPIPAKYRGYYFDGISKISQATAPDSVPVLGVNGAMLVWAFPMSTILQALFDKSSSTGIPYLNVVDFMISSTGKTLMRISDVNTVGAITVAANTWHSFFSTYSFNPATGRTTVKIYLDLVLDTSNTHAVGLYVEDDVNGFLSIGQEYDSGPTMSDFFFGYIWEAKLYNYAVPLATYQSEVLGPAKPASATFTLSACAFDQYVDAIGNCVACLASCTDGCVAGDHCNLCDDRLCGYCTTLNAGSCVYCKSNASFVSGICVCNSGYYYDSIIQGCGTCDPSCFNCFAAGPYNCENCKTSAQLLTGGPGMCVCATGYYPFPHAGNCAACDDSCVSCQAAGSTQCTSCKGAAVLSGNASVGSCVCPSNHLPSSGSNSYCQCPTGTTLSFLNQLCIKCDRRCLSCTDAAPCYQCRSHSHMEDSVCKCDDGSWLYSHITALSYCAKGCSGCAGTEYFLVPTQDSGAHQCLSQTESFQGELQECVPCPEGCVMCTSDSVCLQCGAGWFLHSNQRCSRDCEVPNQNHCRGDSAGGLCFAAALDTSDSGVKLSFSANLTEPLYVSQLSLKFRTLEGKEAYADWKLILSSPYWDYLIAFNNSDSLRITLSFLSPSNFNSDKCLGLSTAELTFPKDSANLNETDGEMANTQEAAKNTQLLANMTLAAAVPVTLTASVLMSQGSQFVWALLLDLQFESYLPMSILDLPSWLAAILIAVNPINLLLNLFTQFNGIGEGDTVDVHLANGGIASYLFIENVADLAMPFITLFSTALAYVLLRRITCLHTAGKATKKLTKDLPQLLIGSHLTICMAITIQIYGYCNGHWRTSALEIAALMFTVCFGCIAVFITIFSYATFIRRIGIDRNGEHSLFAEFRVMHSFGSRGYYVLFCVRRALFCVSQVFLWRYPILQALFGVVHCLWVRVIQFAVYLKLHVHFERRVQKGVQIVSEFFTVLVTVQTQFYLLSLSAEQKDQIAHSIIAVLLVKCAVIAMGQLEDIVSKLKSRAQKKRQNSKVSTDILQSSRLDV